MATDFLPNLGFQDFIIILLIIAALAAPGLITALIIVLVTRRKNRLPQIPPATNPISPNADRPPDR